MRPFEVRCSRFFGLCRLVPPQVVWWLFLPSRFKRSIVNCLHNRAERVITKPSGTAQEKKHLSTFLFANGYPPSFLQRVNKTRNPTPGRETAEFKSTAVLPYIKGVSGPLRRHLQQQGIRTVFKSDITLKFRLVRPKDPADPNKQDSVVYKIPCTCGKVYIGETRRPMHERMKEHDRDIRLARSQNSAVSEHANSTRHKPLWNETKLIDRESHWYTRKVKEAIYIRLNPNNINRDNGAKVPEAWMPTIRKHQNQRHTKNQRTPEETMVHGNNSWIEMHQSQQTTMIYNAVHNQSTPSPEEDLH